MSRVIITEKAIEGLKRCRQFLAGKNPLAARRASRIISSSIQLLETHPNIGRPHLDETPLKELIIEFGATGYIALYRYDSQKDEVYVLSFRHQKEINYGA